MTLSYRRLPPLSALRSFDAVARTLSFTRAAEELGVTQAAVSRQIRLLEDRLAVRLIDRGPAGRNELTDAGDILFKAVHQAFDTIAHSVERISGSGAREILNVSIAPFFSARWLTPRLMNFVRGHPAIELRLHHSYRPADHRREGIDIGINWGGGSWPGVRAEKIMDGSLTPVMSPAFFARMDRSAGPNGLPDQTLLYEFDFKDWLAWFAAAGVPTTPEPMDRLRLSDSHALRRAALDGHGVALFFRELIDDDLANGRLIRPFPINVHTGFDYHLNYPDDYDLPAKTKAFRRWVMDEIGTGAGP